MSNMSLNDVLAKHGFNKDLWKSAVNLYLHHGCSGCTPVSENWSATLKIDARETWIEDLNEMLDRSPDALTTPPAATACFLGSSADCLIQLPMSAWSSWVKTWSLYGYDFWYLSPSCQLWLAPRSIAHRHPFHLRLGSRHLSLQVLICLSNRTLLKANSWTRFCRQTKFKVWKLKLLMPLGIWTKQRRESVRTSHVRERHQWKRNPRLRQLRMFPEEHMPEQLPRWF